MADTGFLSQSEALSALVQIRFDDGDPFRAVLEQISRIAKRTLPEDSEVSITLVEDGRPSTVAFTGSLAIELDERQYERGHGPCLDASESGQTLLIRDTATETRWPDYTPIAIKHGCKASLSVPLPLQQYQGAMNSYVTKLDVFDDNKIETLTTFANYAATPLVNARAYLDKSKLAQQLAEAIKSRATIDQAKGILMERHKLTADMAFDLVRASQTRNVKLREIAAELVESGSLTGH